MTFMQVTKAKQQTTSTCSRTTKIRCSEMQRIQSIVSGGEASALIQKEVLTLSDEERQCLLATAGISSSIEIGPAQVLAIKAGLAIPWNKLRLLRRYDIINACSKGNSLIFQVAEIIRNSSGWRGKDASHLQPHCGG